MNVPLYAAISGLIIMFWYMAFNSKPGNFGFLQLIGVFVLGGIAGYYMQSFETGIFLSIFFALVFI